jgi:hypothetical protein
MLFQAKLAFEGVVARFDDLAQWLEGLTPSMIGRGL